MLATGEASSGQSALDLAMHLVRTFDGLRALDAASIAELCQIKGIGPAKATTIKAALELGKRLLGEPVQRAPEGHVPPRSGQLFPTAPAALAQRGLQGSAP